MTIHEMADNRQRFRARIKSATKIPASVIKCTPQTGRRQKLFNSRHQYERAERDLLINAYAQNLEHFGQTNSLLKK